MGPRGWLASGVVYSSRSTQPHGDTQLHRQQLRDGVMMLTAPGELAKGNPSGLVMAETLVLRSAHNWMPAQRDLGTLLLGHILHIFCR